MKQPFECPVASGKVRLKPAVRYAAIDILSYLGCVAGDMIQLVEINSDKITHLLFCDHMEKMCDHKS
ncbi:hypothetical protein [Yoonia sp. I 8.24]|uniref:hypothetical protein n=1 Tax=Yoonia sp. I 8.24 TaxID=1537229 RepID=UPI001EDFE62D|nr:hypothetical protein [Yoonia sp. I 8.24]MCG3266750.1 hypothetical protein [Yoonia sp. I 8.24]